MEIDGVGVAGSGAGIDYHFCATCGSTVFWTVKELPTFIGIAVGNFVDPDFGVPREEYYTHLRHEWLPPVPGADQNEAFPPR